MFCFFDVFLVFVFQLNILFNLVLDEFMLLSKCTF